MLADWDASKPVYFHLGAKFDKRGELTTESRAEILSAVVEPIFKSAGVVYLYGSTLRDDSFAGEGEMVRRHLRKERNRHSLAYSPSLLQCCQRVFADSQGENHQRGVARGALVFHTPAALLAVESFRARLGAVRILTNFAGPTGAGAMRAIRRELDAADGRVAWCLPRQSQLQGILLFGWSNWRSELGIQ